MGIDERILSFTGDGTPAFVNAWYREQAQALDEGTSMSEFRPHAGGSSLAPEANCSNEWLEGLGGACDGYSLRASGCKEQRTSPVSPGQLRDLIRHLDM